MTKTRGVITKLMACFLAMMLVIVCMTGIKASASWYGWTHATFSVRVNGSEHYYDGNNVGLNWGGGTHNSDPNHFNNSGGFDITLQRKNGLLWTTIGTYRADRSGSGGTTWTNVGSGTYRFVFSKANDSTTQYVTDIEMFSW